MCATRQDLPVTFSAGEAVFRDEDWGDLRPLFISLPGGADVTPLLRGAPDDRYQCPPASNIVGNRVPGSVDLDV